MGSPAPAAAIAIRPVAEGDWPAVAGIYAEEIATGDATFETAVPDHGSWDAGHLPEARLVAADGGRVVGWAALSPSSGRCVYRGVAEVSVYVAEAARGRGVGGRLLERRSERVGVAVPTAQAAASVPLDIGRG